MPTIRPCTANDRAAWLELRQALWPEAHADEHGDEIAGLLNEPARFGQFLALDDQERALGLIEASIRHDYVNGTDGSPVAFAEGMYVRPDHRQQGVATALMRAVEAWALEHGCSELASDAALGNRLSHAVHAGLGFEETERVVFFRKALKGS
ncbi:GNAT family N-acetyltransferase [Paucibacter sp. APW11]|uniref:Aminoglycoside N(6')-acetyltransferase type 1 n=1 Tax=Roseateles aquae TaxID=3077235 RepID=A0ABU3PIB5_9BURK|nr:aminoglycoside 6'-N-acetyltransferase [Paucibacter sp. APW11]MDT9002282.1 GNAT family N-acetyltransferase [Paucibacter sp. APW11]